MPTGTPKGTGKEKTFGGKKSSLVRRFWDFSRIRICKAKPDLLQFINGTKCIALKYKQCCNNLQPGEINIVSFLYFIVIEKEKNKIKKCNFLTRFFKEGAIFLSGD